MLYVYDACTFTQDIIKHPYINYPLSSDDYDIKKCKNSILCESLFCYHKKSDKKIFVSKYKNRSIKKEYIIEYAVTIPSQISHIPGFVHLLDHLFIYSEEEEKYDKDFLITAEEYMENGPLSSYISEKKSIDPTIKEKIIFGIAAAMKSLHSMDITTGGLCPPHIFLDESFEPRIRFAPPTEFPPTPYYTFYRNYLAFLSPEFLYSFDVDSVNIHTKSNDVYSYGIILSILFGGEFPEKLRNFKLLEYLMAGGRPKMPKNVPKNIMKLIERCWSQEPEERPTFEQIVSLLRKDEYVTSPSTDLDSLHEYQDRVDPQAKSKAGKDRTDPHEKAKADKSTDQQKVSEINILTEEEIKSMRPINKLGKGGFAVVEKVARDDYFALKTLEVEGLTFSHLKSLLQEYEILNLLVHPNIVKVFGFFYGSKDHGPSILLELCPTNLALKMKEGSLTKVDIVCIVYEIIEGMKFVHQKGIMHRDLKPQNILIDKNGHVKIADFGIAKFVSVETQTSNVGTQKFMAPELLNEAEKYDNKVDVYSFGVLLFWILTNGQMPKVTIVEIGTGKIAKIPDTVNKFATKLIKDCWTFQPSQRPSFEEISQSLKSNKFKLLDLSDKEVKEVENFVKNH